MFSYYVLLTVFTIGSVICLIFSFTGLRELLSKPRVFDKFNIGVTLLFFCLAYLFAAAANYYYIPVG